MRKNRAGKKAVGFGLIFPSMQLVEIAAQCGFDSINVDGEHGHFTPESVDEICRGRQRVRDVRHCASP